MKKIIEKFFESTDKKGKKKLFQLFDSIPQFNDNINYLVAGSWAIEISSEKRLRHDDIDLIILDQFPVYIDDAIFSEEKCNGIIPLDTEYFQLFNEKCIYENKIIYVPSINFQICMKLIGQLQKRLPKRALKQLNYLLDSYKNFNIQISKDEIHYILSNTTPITLNHKLLTDEIINAIILYKKDKEGANKKFIEIHNEINKVLRNEFDKVSYNIKISNK